MDIDDNTHRLEMKKWIRSQFEMAVNKQDTNDEVLNLSCIIRNFLSIEYCIVHAHRPRAINLQCTLSYSSDVYWHKEKGSFLHCVVNLFTGRYLNSEASYASEQNGSS